MTTNAKLNVAIAFPLVNSYYYHARVKAIDVTTREALLEDLNKVEYRLTIPDAIDISDWEEGTDIYFNRSLMYIGTTLSVVEEPVRKEATKESTAVEAPVRKSSAPAKVSGCVKDPIAFRQL